MISIKAVRLNEAEAADVWYPVLAWEPRAATTWSHFSNAYVEGGPKYLIGDTVKGSSFESGVAEHLRWVSGIRVAAVLYG